MRHAAFGYYQEEMCSRSCQGVLDENPTHHDVFTPSCPGSARVQQFIWKHLTLKDNSQHSHGWSFQIAKRGAYIISRTLPTHESCFELGSNQHYQPTIRMNCPALTPSWFLQGLKSLHSISIAISGQTKGPSWSVSIFPFWSWAQQR